MNTSRTSKMLIAATMGTALGGLSAATLGATVTLSVGSPSHQAQVTAGQRIAWTITAEVSGDCEGLALVLVNLMHASPEPELFALSAAPGAPAGMEGFDRPAGFCNPLPDGTGSAYGGTPVMGDVVGGLLEIGGAQNTFGTAGETMGFDTVVEPGIGQQPGGQVIAAGSFTAPRTPGVYTLELQDGAANVLTSLGGAGEVSSVAKAAVELGDAAFTFEVVPGAPCAADLSGDGLIGSEDLNIVLGAFGTSAAGDVTGDGQTTSEDLNVVLAGFGGVCR